MASTLSIAPKQERSSNFELLRILCIVGVVFLHSTFVRDPAKVSLLNSSIILFVQTICNTGVDIFILLSGYFSIRFDLRKLIKLHHSVVIYALASALTFFYFGKKADIGLTEILSSFVPIIAYKYWFISCYFMLFVFAPYLNRLPELLSKKQFEVFLAIALTAFSILPSLLIYDMNLNIGKGIVNMGMMYLVGRYIRLYWTSNYNRRKLLIAMTILIAASYLLNMGIIFLDGNLPRHFSPFFRDLSINIILLAIIIFMYFRELKLKSKFINRLAANVLAVYMFEEVIRGFLRKFIDPDTYWGSTAYIFVLVVYVVIVVVLCFVVESIRKLVTDRIDDRMVEWENGVTHRFYACLTGAWQSIQCRCIAYFKLKA